MRCLDLATLQAFLSARYECRLASMWLPLHLDAPNPALPARVTAAAAGWALLSASCPHSRPWPARLNACRHQQLGAQLRRRGLFMLAARGCDPVGNWEEASWWVAAPALASIDALAQRYSQHAVLVGQGDAPARLRGYSRLGAVPAGWQLSAGDPSGPWELSRV